MKGKPTRRWVVLLVGLTCAVLWTALLVQAQLTGNAGFIDAFESRFVDLRFKLSGPRPASPEVVIVAIDDHTLTADATANTNNRQLLALLIRNIAESGARALAVDVLLAKPGNTDEDAALAYALSSLPSIIAAAAVFDPDGQDMASVIWPEPVFHDAARAGLVNLSTDAGGTPRYAPMLVNVSGEWHPSLALWAAIAFTGEKAVFGETRLTLGDRHIPLDLGFNMPLRFSGPAGSVQTISASKLLGLPMPDALSGKVVVLGYSASAMGDRFLTPFDDSTPGVEIIATAISQLTGGPTLRRDMQVRIWDAVHATGLTLLCVFVILVWPLPRSLPLALSMMVLSMVALAVVFSADIWMSAALPLAAALPPALVAGALRYMQERQQANRSERNVASYRRFQAPALATKIENDPEYLTKSIEQNLIIFFVDLTGFTGLSHRLAPRETRNLLRFFHALTSETVETRGGSVLNYMGDGAIAIFGLETDTSHQAVDSALSAAFDLARRLSKQTLSLLPDERLACRIGLHAGFASLARMGSETHQQVTVTGDSVNLASRLMEVAKIEKAVIVASGEFFDALTNPIHKEIARQTKVQIRGLSGRMRVHTWTLEDIA